MSDPILSPTGIIHVLGYTPSEGECGVPITVRIHFHPDLADAMYVRLVLGNMAIPTKVKQLPGVSYGRWQLHASAPPFDRAQFSDKKVLISVQALNDENAILDSVTFGEFSYWTSESNQQHRQKLPRLQIPTDTTSLRRRSTHLPTPSPTASERSPFPKSPQRKTRLHRRLKSQSLVRTKQQGNVAEHDEMYAQTPILELVTPLSSMCLGWNSSELASGRRLVRFTKVQDGRRLIVSCEPIPQEEYCESDSVISCIYREEADTCFVTSVDVIYLLERLTNGEFPVEEKNRIRRNLEGLRPTTVSKHKPGFGDFFQRIMEFPDPKPRNIEKDLKVFEWNLLGQALEKILSKYSIYTSSASTEPSPVDSTESPELYALQISYPLPEESRFLDQKPSGVSKFEPLAEEFPFCSPTSATSGGASEPFTSPVDSTFTPSSSSSTSSAFPPFAPDPTAASHPNTWPAAGPPAHSADLKPGDMSLEGFNVLSYEAVETSESSVHNFADQPGLDFGMYDNFAFPAISDDTLAHLAEQYI